MDGQVLSHAYANTPSLSSMQKLIHTYSRPIDDSLIARLAKEHMELKMQGSISVSFVMDIRNRKGN